MTQKQVYVLGAFDDLRSYQVRLLHEASRLGRLCVLLWPDKAVQIRSRKLPRFPQAERKYLLEAVRYVDKVEMAPEYVSPDSLPPVDPSKPSIWAMDRRSASPAREFHCGRNGLECRVLEEDALAGFPADPSPDTPPAGKKVVVTGCFDWFHSGHAAFFEEVSRLGEIYAIVGHDRNIELMKGKGHPFFPQAERLYMVRSIRYVRQALVSSGTGWMDAEPEILAIKPDIYAVNEDGDVPEKREFCTEHGIEYRVLKRVPKAGLPARFSTDLRGF